MAFRILDDDVSNTASISNLDTSTITKLSLNSQVSKQVSELNEDTDEEVEHTIDPYQFESVASDY